MIYSIYKEKFIEEHRKKFTKVLLHLCHMHHLKLHHIYGKRPKVITAKKQRRLGGDTERKTWHGMIDFLGI